MRLLHIVLILTIVVILLEISECRLKRKSSERARSRNERRKERNRRRFGARKRHRKQEITASSIATTTTDESALLVEELLSMKNKYIADFARRRAALLSGQSLFDNLPDHTNRNTTDHFTEALLSAFVVPNSVQNRTNIISTISTASVLHLKGKFGFHSPQNNVFGRMIHISDVGANDSHFGCSGKISNEDEISNLNGPWIALIARGKCRFFIKIKLAEKYGASAVVVYDTVPRRNVEVMTTIGTKITSLMINAFDGDLLTQNIELNRELYVNISVGDIHIEASDLIPKVVEHSYTEAIANFRFISTKEEIEIPMHRTTGRYGRYSTPSAFSARLIHIKDAGTDNSHFACSGAFENEREIKSANGEWVALIEAGKCNNVVKIKLAELYSAKAVVIYDEDFNDEPTVINTIGTRITALTITRQDGKIVTQHLQKGHSSYLNVTVGATMLGVSSSSSSSINFNSLFLLIFSFLICCVTHLNSH